MIVRKYIFFVFWLFLAGFLLFVSLRYQNKNEAMVAVVESQVTAISYQKPVFVETIHVIPGQEVKKGDTLVSVSQPDLSIDKQKKRTEFDQLESELIQVEKDHQSKLALLSIETEGKISRLNIERNELATELKQRKSISEKLSNGSAVAGKTSFADSVIQLKIESIEKEISDIRNYTSKEKQREALRLSAEKDRIARSIQLVEQELQSLNQTSMSLIRTAGFDGIIGTIGVQLDELVPPFKTLISVFETQPTLIKAYVNESITYSLKTGDDVNVVSENRIYEVKGKVLELGARVTSFPEKIQNPTTPRSYGQEVFIRIPARNEFLNGEKVFVYPVEVE